MIRLFIFFTPLILCLLTFGAQVREYHEWTDQEQVLFGMPFIGHVVMPQQKGLITEIFREVYDESKVEFEHVPVPYARALEEVQSGKLDLTLDVKGHRKGVLQGNKTLVFYDMSVAYLRSTGFNGVKSLKGKRVAYLHGFDIKRFLPVKVTPQLVYDLSSAFHLMDRGLVTYVIGDYELLRNAMFGSGLADATMEIKRIGSYKVHPIFAPNDDGRRYRNIYDERMDEMMIRGDLQEILKKYGFDEKKIDRILRANGR